MDPRRPLANKTFKRLFKIADYNRDRSLRPGELRAGMQVLEKAFVDFSKLYRADKATFVRLKPLDDVQRQLHDRLMKEELAGLSQDELLAKAKEAWGDHAPNPDGKALVVRLMRDKRKAEGAMAALRETAQRGCGPSLYPRDERDLRHRYEARA